MIKFLETSGVIFCILLAILIFFALFGRIVFVFAGLFILAMFCAGIVYLIKWLFRKK